MCEFTKRANLERYDSRRPHELTRLAAAIVSSPGARRDFLRLVVTIAAGSVIIAALVATVLVVRPELIVAFVSSTVSR
jgi:hypothetical protein